VVFRDKKGHSFEVRAYREEDYGRLWDMYVRFSPKAKFQGMPPCEDKACEKWLKGLLEGGENYLAWRGNKVIGHVVVLPDFSKGDAEYLIFVDRENRGLGVGWALTLVVIERAEELGLQNIWLTVDAYNFRATRLYKRCGFTFSQEYRSPSERMMVYSCGCGHGA